MLHHVISTLYRLLHYGMIIFTISYFCHQYQYHMPRCGFIILYHMLHCVFITPYPMLPHGFHTMYYMLFLSWWPRTICYSVASLSCTIRYFVSYLPHTVLYSVACIYTLTFLLMALLTKCHLCHCYTIPSASYHHHYTALPVTWVIFTSLCVMYLMHFYKYVLYSHINYIWHCITLQIKNTAQIRNVIFWRLVGGVWVNKGVVCVSNRIWDETTRSVTPLPLIQAEEQALKEQR